MKYFSLKCWWFVGVFLLLMNMAFMGEEFAGGIGTENNPYLVENAGHLDNVRNHLDAHFRQIHDIDLSDFSAIVGWEPIGKHFEEPFTGSFDGCRYSISHLSIDRPELTGVGLFAHNEGELLRISVRDVQVRGQDYVGGLAGVNGGHIVECFATGEVSGMSGAIGGLLGINYGTLLDSYAETEVSGDSSVGGLVGSHVPYGIIENCFSIGRVTGNEQYGGLVGYSWFDVWHSYYDREKSNQEDEGKGTPLSTEQMKQQDSFVGWDFDETWDIIEGKEYPFLRWEKPRQEHYDAQVHSTNLPSSLLPEKEYSIQITMENTGWQTWKADELVYLGAVDDSDPFVSSAYYRRSMEEGTTIKPGESYTFALGFETPDQKDVYLTQWQMLIENEFWFGEKLSKEIEVSERTSVDTNLWNLFD